MSFFAGDLMIVFWIVLAVAIGMIVVERIAGGRSWPSVGLVMTSDLPERVSSRSRLACGVGLERLDGSAPPVVSR